MSFVALLWTMVRRRLRAMKSWYSSVYALCGFICLIPPSSAQPSTAALAGFAEYSHSVEERLASQHRSPSGFLAAISGSQGDSHLRGGEPILEDLTPAAGLGPTGATLYHWRGMAFVAGGTAGEFEQLLRDVDSYPRVFAPQVLRAAILTQDGDRLQDRLRVRQHHVLTVVLDTAYEVTFGRLDAGHGYSASRSTQVSEIDSVGTASEHALTSAQEHGFLWRLNTYWSWEERDGGLYVQIESISLTRSIPTGLGWAVRPFVDTVPRESLEFTLRSARNALGKHVPASGRTTK